MSTQPRKVYPAFHHRSDIRALTSPQDNNVTPVRVVHPANGVQKNMVATQYPGELRVACSPTEWQQGNTQSQQNLQALPQLESQPSTARTGLQQPKPENSVRQSFYNCGQQRECSKRKGANLNDLNFASGDAAQTIPLQDQCSMFESKQQESNPLLNAFLKGNPPDVKSFTTQSFSEETNTNIKLNTSPHFSDLRHSKNRQMKSSLAALDFGKTRTQILDHSGGAPSMPCQHQVSSPSLSSQPIIVKDLSVKAMVPPTSKQISDYIKKMVTHFRKNNSGQSNNVPHPPTTSASNKEDVESLNSAVTEQWTAAIRQALEEDRSKCSKANDELTPTSKESDSATSASKKNSTEYPQIMVEVAATCTKSEDECPVVHTAVSEMTMDELTEKYPSSWLNCNSLKEEYKSSWSSFNKNLDDMDQMPDMIECEGALSVNILKDPQYEDISEEEMSPLDTKPQYEDISDDESPPIENVTVERPSQTQVPEPNDEHLLSQKESYGDVQGQARMKTEIISDEELPKKYVSDHSVSCSPSSVLKDEDEIDDQMDDDWLVIPISMSDLKFEPENEDQDCPDKAVVDDGETEHKKTQCETSPVLASASFQMEEFDTTESFLQAKAVPLKNIFEVELGLSTSEHELDSEEEPHTLQNRRKSYPEPEDSCETEDSCDYSPGLERNLLTVPRHLLKKRSALLPPETDDSVSEKEDEDDVQKGNTRSTKIIHKHKQLVKTKGHEISKNNEIITLDSDTEDESDQNCKKKKQRKRLISFGSDDNGVAPCSQQKTHSPETVASLGRKKKFKTNRQPSEDSPAPQNQSKLNDTQLKEVMQDACSDLSKSREKIGQLTETKCGSEHVQHNLLKLSEDENVIILDSDIEDSNDENCKEANGKRLSSSLSVDDGYAPCVQQKIHSPETVDNKYGTAKEKLSKTRPPSADTLLPQHQPQLYGTHFKEVMQDACADVSHSTEKSGQVIESKGGSEHVQHKTNRQTMSIEGRNTKRILKSGSENGNDVLFARKHRPSTEPVDGIFGTAHKKHKKPKLSSEDSTNKRPQSVGKEVDYTLTPNPVIPESSQPTDHIKLSKESRVCMGDNDESPASKTPAGTSRNKKGSMFNPKPENGRHHSTKNKVQANVAKPRLVSRQHSLPSQKGPSTSILNSSSTSGQYSKARKSSPSSRDLFQSEETYTSHCLPKSKQLSRSYSHPPTLDHPGIPTQGPSSSVTNQTAVEKVTEGWKKFNIPTRKDRKSRINYNSGREARREPSHFDRAPRRRHNSHVSTTPLMKKTKSEARQWTQDRNRDTTKKQRYSVSDGYKWSEKPAVGKQTEGSGR